MNEKLSVNFLAERFTGFTRSACVVQFAAKGPGKRLITDVKNVITSIKRNPYFASIKFENIRTAACKTFPYAIHYEIDEANEIVTTVSVFHFSRNPYWLNE